MAVFIVNFHHVISGWVASLAHIVTLKHLITDKEFENSENFKSFPDNNVFQRWKRDLPRIP